MDSIDSKLTGDETIVYRTKCHWSILLGPMLVIIIGGLALRSQGFSAAVLLVFGLVWWVLSYISLHRSEIGLTKKRILINAGYLVTRSYEIPLSEIVAVDYYQPSLGSMLDFGKVIIVYSGKKRSVIKFVSSPAELVTRVRQHLVHNSTPVKT